ncbi:DUF3310 domain-containing protein [Lactobacillaceae bacterium 24-114]
MTPAYYQGTDNKDLLSRFSEGMMTPNEFRGFCKGNIVKYTTRYESKGGVEDLEKAKTYLERLILFEQQNQSVKG